MKQTQELIESLLRNQNQFKNVMKGPGKDLFAQTMSGQDHTSKGYFLKHLRDTLTPSNGQKRGNRSPLDNFGRGLIIHQSGENDLVPHYGREH